MTHMIRTLPARSQGRRLTLGALALVLALDGCGGGDPGLPTTPRPLVTRTGVRLVVDAAELEEVNAWLFRANDVITEDPSFYVTTVPGTEDLYPWETIVFEGDTARFQINRAQPDANTPFQIYAFLHLMDRQGRLDEWLPAAADAEGYELERAIVDRVGEVWLLGRTVFDAQPWVVLDALAYARQMGQLDALLLTARPEEFAEERERWLAEDPDGEEEFRTWFRDTFDAEPPGPGG